MKKIILPILLGIVFPLIFMKINPNIQGAGIALTAAIGLGIGAAINAAIFKNKSGEVENQASKAEMETKN